MNLQTIVDDVKGRVEGLAAQGQKVTKLSIDTFRQANDIFVDGVQALLKSHTETSKDLLASARSGFEKARADGVKAVLAAPAGYLPPREKLVDALNQTRSTVVKTREELVKLVRDGYASLSESEGEKIVAKAATTARKAGNTARKTAAKGVKAAKAASK